METYKPAYPVGCTGHINLSRIDNFELREGELRLKISSHLNRLKAKYAVTLYSGLANGADSLFAEEALKCGIPVVAVLPEDIKAFMEEQPDREQFNRLFSAVSGVELCAECYVGVMNKLISLCSEILALWDGVKLPLFDANNQEINRGGTYDLICTARRASKKITLFR